MAIVTRAGAGLDAGGRALVPLMRSVFFRVPGLATVLVWNTPWGVVVRTGAARRFVPIPDLTRRIQLGLLGVGLVAAFLVRRRGGHPRRRTFRR